MDADIRTVPTFAARLRGHLVSPVVRFLLHSRAYRLLSGSALLLAYTGRRSGARWEVPVMYAIQGERFVVVAGQPDTGTWWRNFTAGAEPVTVTRAGRRVRCRAQLLGPTDHDA